MTEKKRKILITAAVLILVSIAAVIGIWLYMNRFDPVEYVQAVLDASYKNQTEAYVMFNVVSLDLGCEFFLEIVL